MWNLHFAKTEFILFKLKEPLEEIYLKNNIKFCSILSQEIILNLQECIDCEWQICILSESNLASKNLKNLAKVEKIFLSMKWATFGRNMGKSPRN